MGPFEQKAGIWEGDSAIDAVYLWVDGADPAFQGAIWRYRHLHDAMPPEAHGASRFRDKGELRFSLRSLARFAPWIRHIYLVTNGQVPSWLDRSNPRLSVVTHEQIFPDSGHLPTFNSRAIEMHLHRIPGLSSKFLYFNDDWFLGRPVAREDFLSGQGEQTVFLESWPMPRRPDRGPVHDRSFAFTAALLDGSPSPRRSRQAIAHTPQLFDIATVHRIQAIWPEEIQNTSSHRFRAPTDVFLRILCSYALLESGGQCGRARSVTLENGSAEYQFLQLANHRDGERTLAEIAARRPKFICINDDLPDTPDPVVLAALNAFFEAYYPEPSPFERRPG